MKKILLSLIVIALFQTATYSQKAKKPFTGIVSYNIEYIGDWDPVTLSSSPKSSRTLISGNRVKNEMVLPGQTISQVINTSDSSSVLLISTIQGSFYVKFTKDNINELKAGSNLPTINYLDETKEIAGFVCNKAEYIVIDDYGDQDVVEIWYTKELSNEGVNFGQQFHGFNGFPMEYTVVTEQGTLKSSVTSVKKAKIKDIEFLIPTSYQEITFEQYKSFIGM